MIERIRKTVTINELYHNIFLMGKRNGIMDSVTVIIPFTVTGTLVVNKEDYRI